MIGHQREWPPLDDHRVLVWAVEIENWMADREAFIAWLDPAERARLDAMGHVPTRQAYAIARGWLRMVLGHYAPCSPAAITFAYGEEGKPAIAGPTEAKSLRFNLSHSRGHILIALARNTDVGVDLEPIRPRKGLDALARRFFSESEQAAVAVVPEADRPGVFFPIWCRKEACLKALGRGVTYPLAAFDVAEPGRVTLALPEGGPTTVHVSDLAVPFPGYAAALATAGTSCVPTVHRLTP